MKVDTSIVLHNLDGKPLKDQENKDLTVGMVCIEALLAVPKDDTSMTGEEKVKRYDLSLAIHAAKEPIDLKVDDVSLIKGLIGKYFTPMVVGQAWKILDPAPVEGN